MATNTQRANIEIDTAIIGGGIAGAWIFRALRDRGQRVVLLEAEGLGAGQTLASQGMIHGGLKYALSGNLTGASEAIADMPSRWQACLNYDASNARPGDVDLRNTELLSQRYYMFAGAGTLGRLTTFFASRALRGRIDKLSTHEWPDAFTGFKGTVYGLNDFVIDTQALLQHLVRDAKTNVLKLRADGHNTTRTDSGFRIDLDDVALHAPRLISCAGTGSQDLLNALGIAEIAVQHRPLKQVLVRPKHNTALYAHCLTGVTRSEPRLTITTHATETGCVWYLGGQIATEGVDRSDAQQIEHAKNELQACVPWLDWRDAEFSTLSIDRAEPRTDGGRRPDEAYVAEVDGFIQCFPTKLSLAPDLADRVLAHLPLATSRDATDIDAASPWQLESNHGRAHVDDWPWSSKADRIGAAASADGVD